MPLDQVTVEKFFNAFEKRARTAGSADSTAAENIVNTYKFAIESDVGYSFEKTLNRAIVTKDALSSALFSNLEAAVSQNLEALRNRKLINAETVELVKLQKAAKDADLNPENMRLIQLIRECGKSGGGTCDASRFTSLILANDAGAQSAAKARAAGYSSDPTPDDSQFMVEAYISRTYNIATVGGLCSSRVIVTDLDPSDLSCGLIKMPGAIGVRAASNISIDEDKLLVSMKYNELAQKYK
ncbi:hypothetical protein [Methylobacterium sp. GXF4]|uniref:hypothetical protein n=1 Tax=Methylobacterium sp. GXF4 TaxID=1096546 RepID=UPI000FFF25DE|nr:hypothetical protein [Methylobacterium sp. GXF4]